MRSGGRLPPLRRIHSDRTYERDLRARDSLAYHRSKSTEEIVESLRWDADEPLRVKPDGRIFQGNTRVKVLRNAAIP